MNAEHAHKKYPTSQQVADCIQGSDRGRCVVQDCAVVCSDPVFKAVGVPALFAAQVNEEVCGSGSVLWGHIPHYAEGVAGHLTNLDIARGGKRGVHFCHLQLTREIREDGYRVILDCNTSARAWQHATKWSPYSTVEKDHR